MRGRAGIVELWAMPLLGSEQKTKHGEVVPINKSTWQSFLALMRRENCKGMRSISFVWKSSLDGFCRDNGAVEARVPVQVPCGPICRQRVNKRQVAEKLRPKLVKQMDAWGGEKVTKRLRCCFCIGVRPVAGSPLFTYSFCVDKIGAGVDGLIRTSATIMSYCLVPSMERYVLQATRPNPTKVPANQ